MQETYTLTKTSAGPANMSRFFLFIFYSRNNPQRISYHENGGLGNISHLQQYVSSRYFS